jgi:hypothetical protein
MKAFYVNYSSKVKKLMESMKTDERRVRREREQLQNTTEKY